jgi:outer membrane protein, heavy metal efflux system
MQKLLLFCALSMVWAVPVGAQTAPANLRDLFFQTWERSVASSTAQGRQLEAEAGHVQASSLLAGAPALGLLHRSDRYSDNIGQRESEVTLSAPVWLPGQRSARGKLADAVTGETDANTKLMQLDVANALREQVWSVVAAQAELETAHYRLNLAQSLQQDVTRRVKAGDLARTDLLLSQHELLSAQAAAADAELRLSEARSRLTVLSGRSVLPPAYDEVPAKPDNQAHPRIEAAQRALTRAESQRQLVAESRRDQPELGVSYRDDRSASNVNAQGMVGVFVRIPFATDARNKPREAAAQTELLTARAEALQTEYRVQAGIELAANALAASERRVELATQRQTALDERLTLLRKSFDYGELALPELLRSQTQTLEAKADLVRQRALRGLAIAKYNQALGVLP